MQTGDKSDQFQMLGSDKMVSMRISLAVVTCLVSLPAAGCGKQQDAAVPADSTIVKRQDLDLLRADQAVFLALKQSLSACVEAEPKTVECFVSVVQGSGIAVATAANVSEEPLPAAPAEPTATPTVPPEPTPPPSAWVYSETKDEMSGKTTKLACVLSTTEVSFDFPYGSQYARLCLRDHPKYGKDVYVVFDKAQFLCGYDGCRARVKFGEKSPVTFTGNDAADHSTNILFLSPFNKFFAGVKSAETTLIEAQFYQEGERQIKFPTAGLVWK